MLLNLTVCLWMKFNFKKAHVLQLANIVDKLDIPVMGFGLKMISKMSYLKAASTCLHMQIKLRK